MTGTGRACIGLGLAGQGVAILSGIVPHEDPIVGAGLLGFGAVLTATGILPRLTRVTQRHVLSAGAAMLIVVTLAWWVTRTAPAGPLVLLLALSCGTLLAGAFHARELRLRGRVIAMRDLGPCMAIAVGAPLLVWLAQATFKRLLGATPVEGFEIAFLVTPIHWILGWSGFSSSMDGQLLTLAGPTGPMSVEIGVACSGLQAMALFLGILGMFAVAARPSNRRLVKWAAIGLTGVYLSNVVRLLVVILSGHYWGTEVLYDVHAHAGWAFFVAWSLLFAVWVRRDLTQGTQPFPAR